MADQELDPLFGVHVELFLAHLEVAYFGSATHDPPEGSNIILWRFQFTVGRSFQVAKLFQT